MVGVNLLPWRQQKRAYQEKLVRLYFFLSLMSSVIFITTTHIVLTHKIGLLRHHIQQLQKEKQTLLTMQRFVRPNAISQASFELAKNMLAYQLKTNDLLARISQSNDANVCFTEVTRQKNIILFAGNARSALALSNYLKAWNVAAIFSEIKIDSMQQPADKSYVTFRFRAVEEGVGLEDQGGEV